MECRPKDSRAAGSTRGREDMIDTKQPEALRRADAVVAVRVRNLQPGQRFRLKRTGDLYEFLGHKRDTPGGTQYVVRRSGFAKPTTLHHSCHVALIQDDPS